MEPFQCTDVFVYARTEAREPIMVLTLFLPKSAPRHNADTGLVQQLERVERIGLLSRLARCLNRTGGQANAWVQIERAWRVDAGYALERIETPRHRLGALRERGVRRVRLGLPERVAGVAGARWADHAVDADLAAEWGAEADGDHLVDEREDVVGYIGALKVAAAPAALARDALGDGVEGEEGDLRVERADDLFERGEGVRVARVEVRLVDFVREQDEVVLLAETHDALHRRLVEQRARRVARVDDHERLGLDPLLDRLADRGLDVRRGRRPARLFVEVVGYPHALVRRERRRVQRVLRDRNEDARLGARDERRYEQRHTRGGASGQEDVVWVRGVAVSFWEKKNRQGDEFRELADPPWERVGMGRGFGGSLGGITARGDDRTDLR